METARVEFHPVTADRWADFAELFGPKGACAGCWCMFFRQTRKEFDANRGEQNKAAMKALIESGRVPGILAYVDGKPAGWCSVAPREEFTALQRSRTLKPVDDRPVWSVVCFFVARPYRRQGISVRLLQAAVAYARSQGARIVEGYPVETAAEYPDTFAYIGLASAFRKAGFTEVARPSERRLIMRYELGDRP